MTSFLIIGVFILIVMLWPTNTIKARVCTDTSKEPFVLRVDPCCEAGDIFQHGSEYYTVLEIIPRKKRKQLSPEARERIAITVAVAVLTLCIVVAVDFCSASLMHLKVSRLGIVINRKAMILIASSFLVAYFAIMVIIAKYAHRMEQLNKANHIYS